MHKILLATLFLLSLINCSKLVQKKHFVGYTPDKRDSAVLELRIIDNDFSGHYRVYYNDKSSDSGTIKGSIFGDTLKGRFTYVSRHNAQQLSPIIFLKKQNDLKLGTGEIYTLYNIPFYHEKSISFPDYLLYFKPLP